ncbi:MAG: TetR/AcrR family transcriptional regulator [Hydrocarboniphaga sp.]|uniref:TetR/AcrR family transcriptional regulator n=1 Tax=Hydrocarboniphaga sp. TaxID=2033016 RepID=UPI002617EF1F|nr:TetR/AcrR family transcriptional regulator [Hydrocarboniphaga sp.]MDB5972203.1 TetR/AcrR family transcriptional regulator [Hydrocarboniphaga sp.]
MSPPRGAKGKSVPAAERRRYDSPLRQQQTTETRDRILAAGADLVRGFPSWDWQGLTFRAVGERAGVSERTVHRHFSTERKLRDALVQRLTEESGVTLEGLKLDDFVAVVTRMFSYLSSFAVAPATVADPSFAAVDQHRRDSLLGAVVGATPGWSVTERQMAAAVLDMVSNVPPYERLIAAWHMQPEQAIRCVTWVIGLVEEAIRQGRRPGLGP